MTKISRPRMLDAHDIAGQINRNGAYRIDVDDVENATRRNQFFIYVGFFFVTFVAFVMIFSGSFQDIKRVMEIPGTLVSSVQETHNDPVPKIRFLPFE